jgi:hypothetical protein
VEAALFSVVGDPAYDMPGTAPDAVDGTDATELRRVCAGADVVYLCLNAHYVDWYERFPRGWMRRSTRRQRPTPGSSTTTTCTCTGRWTVR